MRSLSSGWAKGSVVAVDAGVHLSAITKILEQTQPEGLGQCDGPSLPHTLTTGPFAGLQVPNARADANAAYIHRTLIETYLITHPHLDHIAGFVINTAGLPGARPKRVAGLPSTISALKTHVFNNVIWPNLSDENNGAGLVTYMRLVEGGSPALGEGDGKGYLEVCDGLAVKVWSVSHGHCIEKHSHRGSTSTRHGSFDGSSTGPGYYAPNMFPPSRLSSHHTSMPPNLSAFLHQQQQERMQCGQLGRRGSSISGGPPMDESVCVYDSSAYFIRDVTTGREILMFGDVEPDSISLSPRNRQVWQEAAPKFAAGRLAAIFIECSYDDSQCVDRLFGHLTPRYICEEMTALAEEVVAARRAMEADRKKSSSSATSGGDKKRKRVGEEGGSAKRMTTPQPREHKSDVPVSPKTLYPVRRVDSIPNSLSLSDYHASHMQHLPKTLPLPTHVPPRNNPTADTGSGHCSRRQPDQDHQHLAHDHDQEQDQDVDMTSHPSPSEEDPGPATPQSTVATAVAAAAAATTGLPHIPPAAPLPPSVTATAGTGTGTCTGTATGTATGAARTGSASFPLRNVLRGLRVVVIHVKERMSDGPAAGDVILRELVGHEKVAGLGVEYVVSRAGQHLFL